MTMYQIKDNAAEYIYVNGALHEYRAFQSEKSSGLDFEMPFSGNIIYEVVRFIDRKGVFLKDHYDRFMGSVKLAGMESDFTYEAYKDACRQLLKANNMQNNNLKLMYAYTAEVGKTKPICLIYASKSFYPDEPYYVNGIATAVLEIERPTPNAKISRKDYIEKVQSYREEKCVFEVLLKNAEGALTEGGKSNLFFIKGNTVFTAPSNMVLEGIMRKYVFEICNNLHISVDDSEPVAFTELPHMDCAFLTGTSINVLPISCIEEIAHYDIKNTVLQRIMKGFEERIAEEWQKN